MSEVRKREMLRDGGALLLLILLLTVSGLAVGVPISVTRTHAATRSGRVTVIWK